MGAPVSLLYTAPLLALGASFLVLATALAVHFRERLPRVAAGLLTFLLVGYAIGNRSFAYLGVPPVFIGEVVLVVTVCAALVAGRAGRVIYSAPGRALVTFMCVGAIATLPYLPTFGLDALRDAVLWGYGTIALAILALASDRLVPKAVDLYARFVPVFLSVVPAMLLFDLAFPTAAAAVTFQGIPVLTPKHGDVAVHLGGIGVFLGLGLHRTANVRWSRVKGVEWALWILWIITFALISDSRGGMLSVLLAMLVTWLLARRQAQFWRPAVLTFTAIVFASSFQVELGSEEAKRSISVSGIVHRLQSAFVTTGDLYVDGTREWRLRWWSDILDYTIGGPYRWLGKGYGVNLADDDGYQVWEDGSLRSPHNGHLTVLARSGVVGLSAWLTFLATLLVSLTNASRFGPTGERPYTLWLLAYLIATLTNATFDVYVEGPQGGIWFWSLAGTAMAMLMNRSSPGARRGSRGVADHQCFGSPR